ncbi:MAG: hypothetical protein WBV33_05910 [Terracidiphilus sp.]
MIAIFLLAFALFLLFLRFFIEKERSVTRESPPTLVPASSLRSAA